MIPQDLLFADSDEDDEKNGFSGRHRLPDSVEEDAPDDAQVEDSDEVTSVTTPSIASYFPPMRAPLVEELDPSEGEGLINIKTLTLDELTNGGFTSPLATKVDPGLHHDEAAAAARFNRTSGYARTAEEAEEIAATEREERENSGMSAAKVITYIIGFITLLSMIGGLFGEAIWNFGVRLIGL